MDLSFGRGLRLKLDEAGLTGAELARRLSRNKSTISRWLNDEDLPEPNAVVQIADELSEDRLDLLRLAGYLKADVNNAVPKPVIRDPELRRRYERMDELLSAGYPRRVLLAVLDASLRMAETPDSEPPVSATREGRLSAPERRLNRGRRASDRDLSTGQHVLAALFRTPALATS